jgi:hypothetical protein
MAGRTYLKANFKKLLATEHGHPIRQIFENAVRRERIKMAVYGAALPLACNQAAARSRCSRRQARSKIIYALTHLNYVFKRSVDFFSMKFYMKIAKAMAIIYL